MPTATEADRRRARVRAAAPIAHLYVHFPFCARKCPYCDFNSHAQREAEIDAYVEALGVELDRWRDCLAPETVFVGGGTPTHAAPHQLARYLAHVRAACPAPPAEFTVEANPGSLTPAKVEVLAAAGVTRVSVGVQSFDDALLRRLGRIHDAQEAEAAFALLRAGGFEHLSLDLILALPGQTLAAQERDVRQAVALAPEHVSAYVLTYEEGTAFTRAMRAGRLPAPDDDRELEYLHVVRAGLEGAGYRRYEISNYARAGAECRHNLAYWRDANWLGVGAGAHSHVGAWRWKNEDGPSRYIAGQLQGAGAIAFEEASDPKTRVLEKLMMGLRLAEGVDLGAVGAATGVDVLGRRPERLALYAQEGLLVREGPRVRLTPRGFDVVNAVVRGLTA